MKKYIFVIILAIVAILSIICGGFAYWQGKQPKVTHYQNGQIKTIIPRDFFKEVGEAKFYDENGRLIQKYNVVNGVKEGRSVVYFNDGEIEFNYIDGKISGKVNIETDEDIPEFQDLSIKATEGTIRIKKKDEHSPTSSLATMTCDDEQFISVLKNYADKRDKDNLTELMHCLKFDNIKFGECVVNGSFKYPSFSENTKISCEDMDLDISDDVYRFTIKNGRYGKYAINTEISAKKVCPDEKIAEFFMALSDNKKKIPELSSIKDFFGCFNFEKVKFKSNEAKCVFQGGFKYPRFTQNSRLVCETDAGLFKEFSYLPEKETKILQVYLGEIMDAKKVRFTVDYQVKDGNIIFNTKTDNQSLNSTISTSGWDKIIPETLDFAYTQAYEKYISAENSDDLDFSDLQERFEKYTGSIFKNLSLTGANSIVNGKKVSEFKGNLNFFNGFSGAYNSNVYVNDNLAGQLSIQNNGNLIVRINYPLSGKPFIAVGIKFRDGLRDTYKTFSQYLWQFIQKSASRGYRISEMSSELEEKGVDLVLNAVDSAQIVLTDKNGQKVLSGVAKIKQSLNYKDIVNGKLEPTDVLAFQVNTYNNNKIQDVIKSIGRDKLEINGKILPYNTSMLPQIIQKVMNIRLESLGKEVENEVKQFGEMFEQGKLKINAGGIGGLGGVLFVGGIAGYSKAMSKY